MVDSDHRQLHLSLPISCLATTASQTSAYGIMTDSTSLPTGASISEAYYETTLTKTWVLDMSQLFAFGLQRSVHEVSRCQRVFTDCQREPEWRSSILEQDFRLRDKGHGYPRFSHGWCPLGLGDCTKTSAAFQQWKFLQDNSKPTKIEPQGLSGFERHAKSTKRSLEVTTLLEMVSNSPLTNMRSKSKSADGRYIL